MSIVKKQIVFVEHPITTYTYKIARSLKLTGEYETVLITFSEVNKDFFSKAYDKIIVFELSHKINFKGILQSTKKIMSREFRDFLKKIPAMALNIFNAEEAVKINKHLTFNPQKGIYSTVWSARSKRINVIPPKKRASSVTVVLPSNTSLIN